MLAKEGKMENVNESLFEERKRLVREYPELEQSLKEYQEDWKEFKKVEAQLPEDKSVEDYFLYGAKFAIE